MNTFRVIIIATLFHLCSASARKTIQDRISKAANLETSDIIALQFPDIKSLPEDYPFDHLIAVDDLWAHIMQELPLSDLWSLGLVNKHFGALIRHHKVFKTNLLFSSEPEKELLKLLLCSDLPIRWFHRKIINYSSCPEDDFFTDVFWPVENIKPISYYARGTFPYMISDLLPRSVEVEIVNYLSNQKQNFDLSSLEHVFQGKNFKGKRRYYYLPPVGSRPLFEVVPMNIVAMTIFCRSEKYNDTFIPAIISDYILAPWNKQRVNLSDREKEMLAGIFHYSLEPFKDYFQKLNWALYYAEGKKKPKELLAPIKKYLEDLDFDWDAIVPPSRAKKYYDNNENHHWEHLFKDTYIVARQWGLDIRRIASAKPEHEFNMEVLAGRLPKFLEYPEILSSTIIHAVLYGEVRLRKFQKPIKAIPLKPKKRPAELAVDDEPASKRHCVSNWPSHPSQAVLHPGIVQDAVGSYPRAQTQALQVHVHAHAMAHQPWAQNQVVPMAQYPAIQAQPTLLGYPQINTMGQYLPTQALVHQMGYFPLVHAQTHAMGQFHPVHPQVHPNGHYPTAQTQAHSAANPHFANYAPNNPPPTQNPRSENHQAESANYMHHHFRM